jgi:hypothetical protein
MSNQLPPALLRLHTAFKEYVVAYVGIVKLLDAALAAWPKPPQGWDRFDEHLAALEQHRSAVATLLTRFGGWTPADACRIATEVWEWCWRAKVAAGQVPCPREKLWQVRADVGELGLPLRQLADLMDLLLRGKGAPPKPDDDLPWGGTPEWDSLQPLIRHLLRYMHGREVAEVAALTDEVWERDEVSDASLNTAISKANHFLQKQEYGRRLEKVRGEPTVRWV